MIKMFDTEDELVTAFQKKTHTFLSKVFNKTVKRHFVISEFDSYMGVADLVIGTYKPYLSKRSHREAVNINWLSPLLNLHRGDSFDLDSFIEKYNFSRASSLKMIKEYIQAGFIEEEERHQYRMIKDYDVICNEVIAIEAKLKDWKKALQQAIRYKKISDYSYVLMDESYASSALSNLELFEQHNIGFVTMNKSQFHVHTQPSSKNSKKEEYFARVNEAAYSYFTMS